MAIDREGYRDLFAVNIHQQFQEMIPANKRSRFEKFKKAHFGPAYDKVKLFNFSEKLVKNLAKGANLAIVSSTPKAFILKLLKKHGLEGAFREVFGSESTSKAAELERAIELLGSAPGKTHFVTDTEGDIRVGKKLGMVPVAVSWGFHPKSRLAKRNPAMLIGTPSALNKFFIH